MASKNFLPAYKPRETQSGKGNKLQCAKRDKEVPATPEEKVRQRILHWLLNEKKWPVQKIRVEEKYDWVSDPNRSWIRSDIELRGDDDETLVVVECKAPSVLLGGAAEEQALEYAMKSEAKYVWISNGDQHKFLVQSRKGKWEPNDHLEPLATNYKAPKVNFGLPDVNDQRAINRYFKNSFPDQGYTSLEYDDQCIVLSVHKLLFDMPKEPLPFSFGGVHVLEDRGADFHEFKNRSGGRYQNLYGDFIAATSGRVEAMSVAVNTWGNGGIRLCVGVRKPNRKHHALQMDMQYCDWDESKGCYKVYHDGKMSQIPSATVLKAVRESGAGHWLEERLEYIYLGDLYWVEHATWEHSKEFLANLLHYGLIRSNLRDAHAQRKRRAS